MDPKYIRRAKQYGALLGEEVQNRLDAAEGALAFSRQFEFIEQELVRTAFSPLKSEELIFYDTSIPAGAKSVTHRTITQVGQADFVNHYAGDLPNADVTAREDEVKCEDLGVQYFYSVQDLQRAANFPGQYKLDAERQAAAEMAMRRKHDEIAAVGASRFSRTGLINSAAVPLVTPITGAWTGATTAANMVNDVLKLWTSIPAATADAERPDTLAMDTADHALISSKPYGVDSDMTVLKWLLSNLDGCKRIVRWNRLGTAGAGSTKRHVAFDSSKQCVKYNVPELFAQEAPQKSGLKIVTPCHGSTGFTDIRKPLAIAYMDGM